MRKNTTKIILLALLCIFTAAVALGSSSRPSSSESKTETTTSAQTTIVETTVETSAAPTASPTVTPTPTVVPEYVEPIIDEVWYNGYVDPRSVRAEVIHPSGDVTVLVNKYYTLPSDYEPDDLVNPAHAGDQLLRAEAAEAFEAMYDACKEETGQGIYLVSGYRSFSLQEYLFNRSENLRSTAFACKRNAYQGRSEHQLGLALDLCPEGSYEISDNFGETTVGQWVNEHCAEYGFIRRFQGKYSTETGYDNEAWHYRYLGVDLATYLTDNDLSLEAYYNKTQILPGDE